MNKFTIKLCRTTKVYPCVYNPIDVNIKLVVKVKKIDWFVSTYNYIKLVAKVKKTDWFVSTYNYLIPNTDRLKVELFEELTNDNYLMNQLKLHGDKLTINNNIERLYEKNELVKISSGTTYTRYGKLLQDYCGYVVTHFDLIITKV